MAADRYCFAGENILVEFQFIFQTGRLAIINLRIDRMLAMSKRLEGRRFF
jgi:hypothetical protein